MSITKVEYWDREGRMKGGIDGGYFLYTAYAPLDDDTVLIKVGISTAPYQRLVTIHCNIPFPLQFAAFTMVGRKRDALAAERLVLEAYVAKKTRGEWLRMGVDRETKQEFAAKVNMIIAGITGKPVEWQRATGAQIKAFMASKMKELAA